MLVAGMVGGSIAPTKNQMKKYTFIINHKNKAADTRASDDRTIEEAIETGKMLENCFPFARIEIKSRP